MEGPTFWSRLVKTAFTVKHVVARSQEESLVRKLGRWDLTLLGVGASIGAGIFVLTGIAAKQAGPAVCFSFLLAAAMCVLNALAYAELSSRFPESGSAYLYAYLVFGEVVAIVAGVNLLIDYHVGAASIARSLVGYFAQLCKDVHIHLPQFLVSLPLPSVPFLSLSLLAPLILLAITMVLVRGVQESSSVSNALTVLKIFIVLLVIGAGVTVSDSKNLTPFAPKGANGVIEASALVFFAYIGFDAVSNTAEECVQPQRDLPFGIIASLLVCATLYMGVTLVLCSVVPYEKIDEDAPLTTAFKGHGMHWIELVVDMGAVIGLSTTLLVGLYSQARIYLGIARDGLLPKRLAAVDPKSGTPVMAQMVCFVVAGALALFFDVKRLSSVLSIGIMFAYTTVCAAVLYLRVAPVEKPILTPLLSLVGAFALASGFCSRYKAPLIVMYMCSGMAVLTLTMLCCRLNFKAPTNENVFACPWVPLLPSLGVAFNLFMMAQLAWEAWVRLAVVTVIVLCAYAWKVWGDDPNSKVEGDSDSPTTAPLLGTQNTYGSTERGVGGLN
jgi:basic amino acid/polyamine antiporter, APA family